MESAAERRYVDALRQASLKIRALADDNAALRAAGAIAVVGMGCRFPGGASDPGRFWSLLAAAGDAVVEIPPSRFDLGAWWHADPDEPGRIYVRSAALLDDVRGFDAGFFAITPEEAVALDPQQRLLLEVSWETFEDAGIDSRRLAGTRTGVFIGSSNYDYIQAHVHSGDPARITAHSGSGVMVSTAAGRLSYFYDLRGPCLTLDTACSSSLVALEAAIKALRRRDCDAALAGGVSLCLSPDSLVALCKVRALSRDGRSRAFDDAASGYGRGEGCGLLLLKRLEDASRDGDTVHAVLAGAAVNHDGRSNGLTAPNGLAQQAVIRAALEDAGLGPDAIDCIEAHGTGTALGDPVEFGALAAVFGARPPDRVLHLGSVKTNIGHAEAAAGIAGVIKTILALRNGTIPASLHHAAPNRHIDWAAAPIRVVTQASPWAAGPRPRAAGVSSFGLSGTNAHVVILEAPAPSGAVPAARPAVAALPLSAASEPALAAMVEAWRALLAGAGEDELAALCATAARRTPLRHRCVALGRDAAEMVDALRTVAARRSTPAPVVPAFLFPDSDPPLAALVGALHAAEPAFRDAFDRCAAMVRTAFARPLLDLVAAGTATADPAAARVSTYATQVALAALWRGWGVRPAAVAGCGVGEWAAATVAGAVATDDALRALIEGEGETRELGAATGRAPQREAEVAFYASRGDGASGAMHRDGYGCFLEIGTGVGTARSLAQSDKAIVVTSLRAGDAPRGMAEAAARFW